MEWKKARKRTIWKRKLSAIEQINSLTSSTELEQDTREQNLPKPKRLTITNPMIKRLNNPAQPDHKNRQTTERPGASQFSRKKLYTDDSLSYRPMTLLIDSPEKQSDEKQ